MTLAEALELIGRAKSAIQTLEHEATDASNDDAAENYAAAFDHLCDALDAASNNEAA